jgi:thioredoxin reductase (NADPH)
VDSLFVAIGRQPNTAIFKEQIERHPNAYTKVAPGTTQASVPGVFAS